MGKFKLFSDLLAGSSIMCACVGDPGNSARKHKVNSFCFLPMRFSFAFQSYFVCNTVEVNVLSELLWECLIKDKLQ